LNLLLISRKIWRYRIATLPVIALTLLGGFYVIALKAPIYKVSSSYVLINPPPPPTADDIARDPTLRRINPNNPYTRFSDQSVIVSLLSSSLSSDTARQELVKAGADPRYTVAPDLQLGYSSMVVQVTGVGSTQQAAVHTADVVGAALGRELDRVQVSQGVDPHYMIKTQRVVAPDSPTRQVSSTLRPLVGVFAIGAILLLLAVSAAEALDTLQTERRRGARPEGDDNGDPVEGTPENERQPHRGRRKNRRASNAAPDPTMDGMTGLTQPERILRALSFRGDGTPAPPGELTLSGARLRERTGIKSSSIYVVTKRLRNEGKIERDGRGRWRLPAHRQMADNGHRSTEATRVAGAENGKESMGGNGRTRTAPPERYRS
jgi:hypothetical protein